MNRERWRRVEEVFESALDLPPEQRESFLAETCGADLELRSQVAAMLAADEQESSLDSDIVDLGAAVLLARENELDRNVGRRIGNYKIVREIGRGGMGAVYEAVRDDAEFEQRVAIKLIRRGMDTDFILRRFRHERQILANLNHPFIARLFDGGTTEDGLPYFVMEYVAGLPVNQFCEQNNLSLIERLRLIEKVCQAVAYAHKKQVVHRDIKPGNILVTDEGEVKLLDFGIAKILNPEHSDEMPDSMTGRLMMTPEYASPEQVRGLSVSPATDVYSLGVLFYQLLTGRHPYQKLNSAPHELARAICEEVPLPPSVAAEKEENGSRRKLKTEDRIAGDLDHIVLKSLQKKADERYKSATELAADFERFLNGQSIKSTTAAGNENAASRDEKTIAVLPFKFLNLLPSAEDTDKSFLGLGLTDALITRLSNVRSLTVRPTSAVLKYGSEEENLFAAGSELQANFVLDGRVRLAGERLRVTVQLISIQDKSSLWAGQYDENFTDIFSVQDSISAQVARALETELTDTERKNLAKRGTESAAAYEAYLRGRAIWHSYTEQGIARAIQYFRQAVELDPNFAAAHSGIADLHVALGIVSVLPPAEAFGTAKKSAQRAVELDPNLAEAYASLGFATLAFDWDAEESERLFRKSFALNDNFAPAHEWFAHVLATEGRFEEAIAEMKRALRIDPQSSQLNSMTAYIYHNARRHREGAFYIERALELEPKNYLALQGFGWMYPPLGRGKEAIEYCRRAVEISNRAPLCLWVLAQVLAGEGEGAEAREIIEELKTMRDERYVSPYYFGMLYAALGEFDETFRWLEKTVDERVYWAHWLTAEYRLDPLRKDARFDKLLNRLEREKIKTVSGSRFGQPTEENTLELKAETEENLIGISHKTAEIKARGSGAVYLKHGWHVPAIAALIILTGILGGVFLIKVILTDSQKPAAASSQIKVTRRTTNGRAVTSAISPDGSLVAYVNEENGRQSIWTKPTGEPNPSRVVADKAMKLSGLSFSANGTEIYYVAQEKENRIGSLFRVRAAGGESQRVMDDVYGKIDFAPDGSRFVFRRRYYNQGKDLLLVADARGENAQEIAVRQFPESITSAAWSPDGETIAFCATDIEENKRQVSSIVLLPVGGGEPRLLDGKRWELLTGVAWQPDGKSIYVAGQSDSTTDNIQIWRVSLDGASAERITNDADNYRGISVAKTTNTLTTVKSELRSSVWTMPLGAADKASEKRATQAAASNLAGLFGVAWTPDGKIIYTMSENSFSELWRMNADGTNQSRLIAAENYNFLPAVSPDNRFIVYVSDATGANRLWRMDTDGNNRIELTHGDGDESAQFSPDGKWIVFMRTIDGKPSLAKVSIEGGEPVSLGEMTAMMPAVSPDGQTIAFLLVEQRGARIAIMPFDGNAPTKIFETRLSLAGKSFYSTLLRWSPDGRAVNFIREENGVSNIWSQPTDGKPPKPLTEFNAEEIFYFDFARDGSSLAVTRGSQISDVLLMTLPQ